jgi:serine protease Do
MLTPLTRIAQVISKLISSASRVLGSSTSRVLGAWLIGLLVAGNAHAQSQDSGKGDRRLEAVPPADAQSDAAQAEADLELISALERVVGRSIDRVEKSVVSIARRSRAQAAARNQDTRPPFPGERLPAPVLDDPRSPEFMASEWATGVVIDRAGLVLTVSHVLGDSPRDDDFIIVTSDRKVFHMTVRGSDARSDLAVLALNPSHPHGDDDFVPAVFGDAATLRKGQIVVTLGNPYGIARDGQASASWGIVANLNRKAGPAPFQSDDQKTLHHFGTLIQTDAKLNLGTSGGALVNLRGELVGITVSQAAGAGYELAAGYAIPIDQSFLRIIERLKRGEEVEYGLLGISIQHGDPARMPGIAGVQVTTMTSDGPAAKAGLQLNDVITEIEGQPVADFDELRMRIGTLPPETTVNMTLLRAGQVFRKRVVLAKYPLRMPQIVTERPPAWRGLRVDYKSAVEDQSTVVFGFRSVALPTTGVAAQDVSESSPAWQAGLRRGTIITHVGPTLVSTPTEFRQAIARQAGPVRLSVAGDKGEIKVITVQSEE